MSGKFISLFEGKSISTPEDIIQRLDADPLYNVDLKEIKYATSKAYDADVNAWRDEHHNAGRYKRMQNHDSDFDHQPELPYGITQLGPTTLKRLDKVEQGGNDFVKACVADARMIVDRWQPVAAKFKEVKGRVVMGRKPKPVDPDAAPVAPKTDEASKPIHDALAPMRETLKKEITEYLKKNVQKTQEDLARHDWDLNAAFPVNYNSGSVNADKKKRAAAARWLSADPSKPKDYRPRSPQWVVMKPAAKIAEYIEQQAEQQAIAIIDSYALKMTGKVTEHAFKAGESAPQVVAAEYTGYEDPWSNSVMRVEMASGKTMVLDTKMILNYRYDYGTIFNQFPTRLVSYG